MQELTLHCPNLVALPLELTQLPGLTSLTIRESPTLAKYDPALGHFMHLRELTMEGCDLVTVPDAVDELQNLQV